MKLRCLVTQTSSNPSNIPTSPKLHLNVPIQSVFQNAFSAGLVAWCRIREWMRLINLEQCWRKRHDLFWSTVPTSASKNKNNSNEDSRCRSHSIPASYPEGSWFGSWRFSLYSSLPTDISRISFKTGLDQFLSHCVEMIVHAAVLLF